MSISLQTRIMRITLLFFVIVLGSGCASYSLVNAFVDKEWDNHFTIHNHFISPSTISDIQNLAKATCAAKGYSSVFQNSVDAVGEFKRYTYTCTGQPNYTTIQPTTSNGADDQIEGKLLQIQKLLEAGLITEHEAAEKRRSILDDL